MNKRTKSNVFFCFFSSFLFSFNLLNLYFKVHCFDNFYVKQVRLTETDKFLHLYSGRNKSKITLSFVKITKNALPSYG